MSGRKILHPLQPVGNNQQLLVGGNGFVRLSKKDNTNIKVNENANDLKDRLATNFAKKQKVRSVKNVNQENRPLAFSTKQPTDVIKTKPANDHGQEVKNKSANDHDQEIKTKPGNDHEQEIKTKPANDHDQEIIKKEENSDSEIISWMTSDVAPGGYWKQIAEERRLALAETLKENKDLPEKIERLVKYLEVYKKENNKLQQLIDEVLDKVNELITSQKDNVDIKVNEIANDLQDIRTTYIANKQKSRSVKNVKENQQLAFSTEQSIKTKPANDQETSKTEENSDSEIISWMTSDVPTDGSWKQVADVRRLALAEALGKNKDLHEEIERLQKDLEVYKKENSKLQKSLEEILEEVNELRTSQKDDSGFFQD